MPGKSEVLSVYEVLCHKGREVDDEGVPGHDDRILQVTQRTVQDVEYQRWKKNRRFGRRITAPPRAPPRRPHLPWAPHARRSGNLEAGGGGHEVRAPQQPPNAADAKQAIGNQAPPLPPRGARELHKGGGCAPRAGGCPPSGVATGP